MTALDLLRDPVWQRIALVLLHFLWQGALIALLLGASLSLRCLRRPQVRYAAWLAGLMLMAACPCITFLLIDAPAHSAFTQRGDSYVAPPHSPPVATGGNNIQPQTPTPPISPTPPDQLAAWVASTTPYVVACWLAGITLFGGRLLLGFAGVHWLVSRRCEAGTNIREPAELLARRMGLRRLPRIAVCGRAGEAMAIGFVRPLILLPGAWITELPPEVLRAVLAHELAHIRRWDVWANLLQRIVETLLFYHPAVWWVSRRVRAERELCCDNLAVQATGERIEYAQALECVAQRRLTASRPLLATGIGGRKMAILRRVRHVLEAESDGAPRTGGWTAGLIALAVPPALWVAVSVLAPPVVGQEERAIQRGDREMGERREGPARETDESPRDALAKPSAAGRSLSAERQLRLARQRAEDAEAVRRRADEMVRDAIEERERAYRLTRESIERSEELSRQQPGAEEMMRRATEEQETIRRTEAENSARWAIEDRERDRAGVGGAADERKVPPFLLPEAERRHWLWNWSEEWREGQRRERERREREDRGARARARERWIDVAMRREAYQSPEAEWRDPEPEDSRNDRSDVQGRHRDDGSQEGSQPPKEVIELELVNHILQLRRQVESLKRELQEMRGNRDGAPFSRETPRDREQDPFGGGRRQPPSVDAFGPGGAGAFGPAHPPKRPTPPERPRYYYEDERGEGRNEARQGDRGRRDDEARRFRSATPGIRPPFRPGPPVWDRPRRDREEDPEGGRDRESRDDAERREFLDPLRPPLPPFRPGPPDRPRPRTERDERRDQDEGGDEVGRSQREGEASETELRNRDRNDRMGDATEAREHERSETSDTESSEQGRNSREPAQARLDTEGSVLSVADRTGKVEISLGATDGLRSGRHLDIYRDENGAKTLGRIEIIHVAPDRAVGRVISEKMDETMREGDSVTTRTIEPDSNAADRDD